MSCKVSAREKSATAAATEEASSLWVETAGTQDGRIGHQNEQEAIKSQSYHFLDRACGKTLKPPSSRL